MSKTWDCVLCGSCVMDILVRPWSLNEPVGGGKLIEIEPIRTNTGGIVSNSGTAMARLGMNVAAFSWIGNDAWGAMIRQSYEKEGIDTTYLAVHPTAATSTTIVLIDRDGERSFGHCVGATKLMDKKAYLDQLDMFGRSRMMLIGYYSLLPMLEEDLPEVLRAIRGRGCRTAMDTAGTGGGMQPLDRILPELDVYVPSRAEAERQTGEHDPQAIIRAYRSCGAKGLLGVKLGSQGALLSEKADEYVQIEAVRPPGEVVDTTGAGDSFYAGLLTGLLKGMSVRDAGRLGAAAGACCVTGVGASAGLRGYNDTAKLAGIG